MQPAQIAIVTGGAGLIGAAVAARLARAGAAIAIFDRSHTVTEQHMFVECDVADRSAVRKAVAEVETRLGTPTVLVNCAGVLELSPLLEMGDDLWSDTLRVNLTGTFIPLQEVAKAMGVGGGAIVNLSSVAAVLANTGQAAYAASKAAVLALTRAAAVELGPRGITVNAVAPGPVQAAAGQQVLTDEQRARRLDRISVGRFCEAPEVADAVAYLASPAARYVTGTVLWIDGGLTVTGIRA